MNALPEIAALSCPKSTSKLGQDGADEPQEARQAIGLRVPSTERLYLYSLPGAQKRREAIPSPRILFLTTEHEALAGAAVQSLPDQTSYA